MPLPLRIFNPLTNPPVPRLGMSSLPDWLKGTGVLGGPPTIPQFEASQESIPITFQDWDMGQEFNPIISEPPKSDINVPAPEWMKSYIETLLGGIHAQDKPPSSDWFKTPLAKMKPNYQLNMFEIPDNLAMLRQPTNKEFEGLLGQFLRHSNLYSQYPDISDVKFKFTPGPPGGAYNKKDNSIAVKGYDEKQILQSILHEINHLIAHKEGFPQGSSPTSMNYFGSMFRLGDRPNLLNKDYDQLYPQFLDKYGSSRGYPLGPDGYPLTKEADVNYLQTLGELTSRTVSNRLELTPGERKAIPFEADVVNELNRTYNRGFPYPLELYDLD